MGLVALAVVTVVLTASFTLSAASAEVPAPRLSATVGNVSGPTADALRERSVDSPFLVTWLPDPLTIGAAGFGLFNELLRGGFDARADRNQQAGATRYRVMDPDDATLEVHLAVGPEIERWRAKPGFVEVTVFDPRTCRERTEFEHLRTQVIDGLERTGHRELVPTVDDNMFVLTFDDRVLGLPQAQGGPNAGARPPGSSVHRCTCASLTLLTLLRALPSFRAAQLLLLTAASGAGTPGSERVGER